MPIFQCWSDLRFGRHRWSTVDKFDAKYVIMFGALSFGGAFACCYGAKPHSDDSWFFCDAQHFGVFLWRACRQRCHSALVSKTPRARIRGHVCDVVRWRRAHGAGYIFSYNLLWLAWRCSSLAGPWR